MEKKPRILGLDYGMRRIGVAISDPLGITAQPLTMIRNQKDKAIEALAEVIREKAVKKVVIGLPKHMSGQEGDSAEKARALGQLIQERCQIEVVFIDERLSTVAAQRILTESGISGQKKRQAIDMMAAGIILQTWMDSQKHQ